MRAFHSVIFQLQSEQVTSILNSMLYSQDEIQKKYIEQEKEKEWIRFKVGTSLFSALILKYIFSYSANLKGLRDDLSLHILLLGDNPTTEDCGLNQYLEARELFFSVCAAEFP